MIKKAMIMAAGVGSRLGCLSDILPKPLVPIANIPVIDLLLQHLASFNIKNVIANTYYKAENIQQHCKNNDFEIDFNYVQENELSGTAGGLAKCKFFFEDEDDFIVMSGDGLCDIDINLAYEAHKKSDAIVTIVTKEIKKQEVSKYGIIVPDKKGFVENFQEKPSIEEARSNLANTGIYLFKNEIFNFILQNTFFDFAKNVFPLLMEKNIKINTYNHKGYWSDIGSIEQYKQSNIDVLNNMISFINPNMIKTENGKYIKGKNTIISDLTKFEGNNVIGNNCIIDENVIIKNSILWDNIEVGKNVKIENSIILSNSIVKNSVSSKVVQNEMEITV